MVEHISKKSANRLKAAERLGIDEALKKGHGQFVVLVNLNTKKPLPLPSLGR